MLADRSESVGISKDDWMNLLNAHHITRAEMNKLVMNYLVTGKWSKIIIKKL